MGKIKPCEYCDFDKYEQSTLDDGIQRPNVFYEVFGALWDREVSMDGQMYRESDGRCYISVYLNGFDELTEIDIKYCPMCGRKLVKK